MYTMVKKTIDAWITNLDGNTKDNGAKARCELEKLKDYLSVFKNVAGLILVNLYPHPSTKCNPDMTENFQVYLDEMKKMFPDFGIGVELIGTDLIDCGSNPPACIKFKNVDTSIDFYSLDTYYFNDCTEKLKVGGATPINGYDGRTLEKLVAAVKGADIPLSKTYIAYRSCASPIIAGNLCNETNTRMCSRKTNDGFCSDTIQTFFDKGKFAKDNLKGFIMINTDIADDANSKCKCETPFPAFHAVLAGYKGLPAPKACPLLDKC